MLEHSRIEESIGESNGMFWKVPCAGYIRMRAENFYIQFDSVTVSYIQLCIVAFSCAIDYLLYEST